MRVHDSESRATMRQLRVHDSESRATMRQLRVHDSESRATMRQLRVHDSESRATMRRTTLAPTPPPPTARRLPPHTHPPLRYSPPHVPASQLQNDRHPATETHPRRAASRAGSLCALFHHPREKSSPARSWPGCCALHRRCAPRTGPAAAAGSRTERWLTHHACLRRADSHIQPIGPPNGCWSTGRPASHRRRPRRCL